ncbi:hypothetical protein NQZ68_016186 [Dissostichus eleginoides]|nr:hypothetical protein NQZ68_016186 [Dissostichus eleginoides]
MKVSANGGGAVLLCVRKHGYGVFYKRASPEGSLRRSERILHLNNAETHCSMSSLRETCLHLDVAPHYSGRNRLVMGELEFIHLWADPCDI